MNDISDQLQTIASDVHDIKQAVMGDSKIGLNGLVRDMSAMQRWKASIDLRVASISGGVAVFVLFADVILNKIFK